jgi:hypothetical protein
LTINRANILAALREERDLTQKGICFTVIEAAMEDGFAVATVRPSKVGRSSAVDEALEGARVKWGAELEFGGVIKFVDAEQDQLVIEPFRGAAPDRSDMLWVFLNDFLSPLIELWDSPLAAKAKQRLEQSHDTTPLQEVRDLPAEFDVLRARQKLAVQAAHHRVSLVIGPPGTGKSFTVGATAAYLLRRFSKARILILGPTNVAVDNALLVIDDWLERLGRTDLRHSMKRLGAHFDGNKYVGREHLLAPGIAEASKKLLILEMEEPPKSRIADYVRWMDRIGAARAALKSDVESVAGSSRVVAMTIASAFKWQPAVMAAGPWPFVICDEASQVVKPAALMATTFGAQTLFAGDPHQLAPIVQSKTATTRRGLEQTAFETFAHVPTVKLNEQSRMAQSICHAVATAFYGGDLHVCAKARQDAEWKRERSPFFVDGREVPRVCFDQVKEGAQWSPKYGGFIRFESGILVRSILDQLKGSYTEPDSILVLTPFRAQRAFIREVIRSAHRDVKVSTVHRAQGSECRIVIFDPVDASSQFLGGEDGRRLVNVAISRAQAHAIIPYNDDDLKNDCLATIYRASKALWQKPGKFWTPFTFAKAS